MIKNFAFIIAVLISIAPAAAQHAIEESGSAQSSHAPEGVIVSPSTAGTGHSPAANKVEMTYSHPELPPNYAGWAGALLIVIAGMFLAAAVIGPVVRAEMPEEVPAPDHSHDHH